MMWSDKAFAIYMGDAGTDTQFDANPHAADSVDELGRRTDGRATDPCSDGDTRRATWLGQPGPASNGTRLRGAARG